jgi:hypothetical protein
MLRHPPTWIAGVAAFCVYWYFMCPDLSRATSNWDMAYAAAWIAPPVFLVCLQEFWRWFCDPPPIPSTDDTRNQPDPLTDPDALSAWLKSEKPIKEPQDDMFRMAPIARRLCRIAMEDGDSRFAAMTLEGPYGAGKTSILKLMEYYIKNLLPQSKAKHRRKLITCRADTWGTDASSAPRLILDAAIKELQKYVDCTALAAVPRHYRQAMQASSVGFLGIVAALLRSDINPRTVLERMDTVATAANLRLLIFIEDADRDDPDGSRLHAINALLDGLHELESISFIFTVKRGSMGEPLVRLSEHIEPMPTLDQERVAECIDIFRKTMLSNPEYDKDIQVEGREDVDKRFGALPRRGGYERRLVVTLGERTGKPLWALASILNTPRSLKTTLRHVSRIWESLHGEVCFDDLLCVQALRFGEPKSYSFLANHIDAVRVEWPLPLPDWDGEADAESEEDKLRNSRVEDWNTLSEINNRQAAECVLRFLLPGLLYKGSAEAESGSQRIRVRTPTDYWARLHACEVDGLRDQTILRALAAWQTDHSVEVYAGMTLADNLLRNPDFPGDQFEQLSIARLLGNDVYQLASELFASVLEELGVTARADTTGMVSLWRVARRVPCVSDDEHKSWLRSEIDRALHVSLPFAMNMYIYWQNGIEGTVAGAPRPELRTLLLDVSQEVFHNDAHALATTLDPNRPYGIWQLVNLRRSEQTDEDWAWLGSVIVDAMNFRFNVIFREVVFLLTKEREQGVRRQVGIQLTDPEAAEITHLHALGERHTPSDLFLFDDKRAKTFFGTRLPIVAEALLEEVSDSTRNVEHLAERTQVARAWARAYLGSDDPVVEAWRERQSADSTQDEGGGSSDDAEG